MNERSFLSHTDNWSTQKLTSFCYTL